MKSLFDQLSELMRSESNNENKCKVYLNHTKEKLVKNTPIRFLRFEPEYRGHTGDSDVIITCEIENEAGLKCKEAYIWEVKSPQSYIFEFDTMNRVKPTKELISAENQLLHYYEEYRGSDTFREEFGDLARRNIHIGGIIIGQKSNLVRPHGKYSEPARVTSLYTRAIDCRRQHFYRASSIDFLIWDRILDLLKSDTGEELAATKIDRLETASSDIDLTVTENREE